VVEPYTFGNFDFTLNGKFLLHSDHTFPSDFLIAGEMRVPMWTSVLAETGDLHNFGGGGDVFGVGREEFEGTVDGSLGTSLKIHGLQPEVVFFTSSEWKAPVKRVVVAWHHPPLCSFFVQRPEQG